MQFISIFNDVLGPVMRGPSSSHTAGSHRIGTIARSLLGEVPVSAAFTFDPEGSYVKTYRQQGVDLAFAAGLTGLPLTDEKFPQALQLAEEKGIAITFASKSLDGADHPNTVLIQLKSGKGRELSAVAKSTGGGGITFTEIDGWPVSLNGKTWDVFVECERRAIGEALDILSSGNWEIEEEDVQKRDEYVLIHGRRDSDPDVNIHAAMDNVEGICTIRIAKPVFPMKRGDELFTDFSSMIAYSDEMGVSLGKAALACESELLGMTEDDAIYEMVDRYNIMKSSVENGLEDSNISMGLLQPTARRIFEAEKEDILAIGGIHTRAAARSMAAMHTSNSMGVVCAAPTGGSAGVIPGVIVTLVEEKGLNLKDAVFALFAAGAVGLIVAKQATFAAEVAGCQVEIGAAGAMAAAAVVEAAGGSARQALDAAAITFQNNMGSVCDPVQGMCEIPCHTRNAVAASSAFVCADLVLGGYHNPVPLDETIDAMYTVGKMLPAALRCTALGGIAAAPSARAIHTLR